jgi:hypothetical protein
LHEINTERPSPSQNEEVDVDKVIKKFGKRAKRSINPDFSPKIIEVSMELREVYLKYMTKARYEVRYLLHEHKVVPPAIILTAYLVYIDQ